MKRPTPRPPRQFPDGSTSGVGHEMSRATVRAIDAYMRLGEAADRVIAAMDNITMPGVVRAPLSEDDSLVMAIAAVAHPDLPE